MELDHGYLLVENTKR